MAAWERAGGLVLSEPGYIGDMMSHKASFVLIDLRPTGQAEKGHIRDAVTIPREKLPSARAIFPEDASAPIVLYSGRQADAEAFETVRSWGYRNVSVLHGGMMGWRTWGGEVVDGPLASTIIYVKRLPPGQVSIEEFTSVLKDRPADKAILDVRGASVQGVLPGAIHIPLEELEANLRKLPRDKTILIYCNTGIMAGIAYNVLTRRGYDARYLDAVVRISPDGSYEITEK